MVILLRTIRCWKQSTVIYLLIQIPFSWTNILIFVLYKMTIVLGWRTGYPKSINLTITKGRSCLPSQTTWTEYVRANKYSLTSPWTNAICSDNGRLTLFVGLHRVCLDRTVNMPQNTRKFKFQTTLVYVAGIFLSIVMRLNSISMQMYIHSLFSNCPKITLFFLPHFA